MVYKGMFWVSTCEESLAHILDNLLINASMKMESREGQGTCVTLTLPHNGEYNIDSDGGRMSG